MRIAFTAKGTKWDSRIDPRFGRTEYLLVYDDEKDELLHFDNRDIENETHGAGPKTAQALFDIGADILITGNGPGGNAARVLDSGGIQVYTGAGDLTVRDALDAFRNDSLARFKAD